MPADTPGRYGGTASAATEPAPVPSRGAAPARPVLPPRDGLRVRFAASLLRGLAPRVSFVENEVAGLAGVVRPGDVCLDLGAEYGLYTYPLARLVGGRGAVHSVEPLPGPAALLAAGIRGLGCANVRLHRVALGGRRGEAVMSLPLRGGLPVHGRAYLTEGARGPGPNVEFRRTREVRTAVTTLDALCRDERLHRVDFIKADVEGAEAAVLQGGAEVLVRHRPTLMLEIEDRHLAKYGCDSSAVVDPLRELGYRMHVFRSPAWRRTDVVDESSRNYLFTANRRRG
ncbi:FkbM family methyltransferase [Sinosporangium siamense]|uniref:Methyltransferase n=1 Tax=Sinosporangium siamense TaxID=1367973 RepID=A0A919RDD0_9ACTN|nr:FkbM family methyltransferase [Sinosporangium siamense]GII91851.1 putative methyltransferase [Sinosporangium siamense]